MKRPLAWGVVPAGMWLGFALDRIGFTNFDEVHRMFTLQSARLYLTFLGAVVLTGVALFALRKRYLLPPRRMQRGTLAGAALFGLGWAVTGACPAVGILQAGTGVQGAVLTLAGMAFGTWLYGPINRRLMHAPDDSCG